MNARRVLLASTGFVILGVLLFLLFSKLPPSTVSSARPATDVGSHHMPPPSLNPGPQGWRPQARSVDLGDDDATVTLALVRGAFVIDGTVVDVGGPMAAVPAGSKDVVVRMSPPRCPPP
jgi:hypothetical protein